MLGRFAPCGSTTASAPSCEPLANNTANPYDFRMRRIIIVAPPKLANATVQNAVVTGGVDMNEPQCGENQTGGFNWLLSFDTNKNTLTTGGAPPCDTTDTVAMNGFPACNPFTTGYCFVNKTVNGIQVGPASGAITQAADGSYSTQPGVIPTLNIPIYFGEPPAIIVLPISNGVIKGVTISPDGNCIGSVNVDAMTGSACTDNYTTCSKWLTAGALTGYITLKTANSVQVSLLSETLCSLLTGDQKGPTPPGEASGFSCSKDASGKITDQGDYCSTTLSAGGCKDSFWLAATFSASAVKINDGTGVPDCSGRRPGRLRRPPTPAVARASGRGAADSGSGIKDAAGQ